MPERLRQREPRRNADVGSAESLVSQIYQDATQEPVAVVFQICVANPQFARFLRAFSSGVEKIFDESVACGKDCGDFLFGVFGELVAVRLRDFFDQTKVSAFR